MLMLADGQHTHTFCARVKENSSPYQQEAVIICCNHHFNLNELKKKKKTFLKAILLLQTCQNSTLPTSDLIYFHAIVKALLGHFGTKFKKKTRFISNSLLPPIKVSDITDTNRSRKTVFK